MRRRRPSLFSVHRTAVSVVFASALACVLGCGSCGKTGGTPTDQMGAQSSNPPLSLKPLPQAPTIDVDPNALPGAGGELAVVAARPQGEVPNEVRPTVTFSKPVKSLEQVESQRAADAAKPFATITPKLEGEWRWLGSASAEFVPKGLVPMSTEYTVTVHQGLTALDGSALQADYTYTFQTPRLQLQEVGPYRGFAWLKADEPIRLVFNQPIAEAELLKGLSFVVEGESAPRPVKLVSKVSIQDERRKQREEALKGANGEGRRYEQLDDQTRGYRNQQMRYVVSADKPFPLGKGISLKIDGALHGEQGPLPIDQAQTLSWRTYGPLEITAARFCLGEWRCPYGPLVLFTSNEVELDSLKGKVTVKPEVELDWENARVFAPTGEYQRDTGPYVSLPGKFRPGVSYTITVAKGATDVFKQTDAKGLSAEDRTDDLEPALVAGSFLSLVEASPGQSPRVPVEVANLNSLDVKMWSLSVAEAIQKLPSPRYYDEGKAPPDRAPDFSESEALKYPHNAPRVHPIQLSKVFKEKKIGLALVQLDSPQLNYHPPKGYRQLVQVTDLAGHLKVGPKKSLVWVTRLSNGAPVEGADVTLYTLAGEAKWSGKTDASGVADVPGAVELKLSATYGWEYPELVIAAQKDGDASITASSWASGVEPYEFGLQQGWEGEKPESAGFVFTDRGIYRPGDQVFIKGVVRYRSVGELRAPKEGSLMTLTVNDSRGNKVATQNVKVTKYGTFSFDAKVSPDAPTGYYSIEANGSTDKGPVTLSGSFRVEEYRAPQFRVDVESKAKSLVQGETLEAKVFSRYLFGGAMADAQVKWSVNRSSTVFSSDAAPDFTFAQQTWWWDDEQPEGTSGFFASGDGRANASGELSIAAGKVEAPGEKPFIYTVEGEVTDVNRQAVAGRTSVMVHPAALYVGVRSSTGFMQAGNEYALDTVVVDTNGKRVAGKKVELTVVSRTWKSVKKKDATGGFTTVSEPEEKQVHGCSLESADGPTPCKFKPAAGGFYIVKAQVKDDAGRKHSSSLGVYAIGPGFVAWQRNDTDRVELVPDKTSYDVGDTAKVLIKSPYPEAQALITTEREGVLSRRQLLLKGSVTTVDIPITEEAVPNLFVGVVLMRPRVAEGGIETGDDPGRPNARIGFVKLAVEKKTKRLQVAVKTDKREYQPGQEVAVDVEVKDQGGKPVDGEVTLYVVDEAVLRLTDYKTPDPIASIFTERPLSVRTGEPLLHLVRRRSYGEKGEAQGGGGGDGEGKGFRSNFKTTVLFNPTLEAKDGRAQAKFKLPDNLTEFRVMAVVITQVERFGFGESSIKVNKPVLVLPALPRFARVGDQFEAGVVVHVYGGAAGEVIVTASVEGAQLQGAAEQKVPVSETAPKEVRFKFIADHSGTATFRFKAVKGSDSDGVQETIPVELPVAIEAVATYGDTKDERVEGVTPPKDVYPDIGGLTVTMASTSFGNFDQGFQQLIEYPYGCLEQQSSRLVPFIALREISGQFGVPWPGPEQKKLAKESEMNAWLRTYLFDVLDVSKEAHPDQVVAKTVKSILALQDGDGSFKYWPSSWCSSSWSSAYATMALYRAKEVGFDVPAEALNRAQSYLTKVAGGQCHPCEYGCDDETRTFAVYVLARSKSPKPSYYAELYGRREKLSLFSRSLLANAMYVGGGDRKQANALMTELLNYAKESAKGLHLEEANSKTYATYFQSDTRTNGAVLQALTDVAPDHPYVGKLARYLTGVRQGDGHWRNTQEAAWSLMGLTEVLRTKEKDTPDFKATVALGGAGLFEQGFKGRSMKVEEQKLPMAELAKKATAADTKLTFKKEGSGVLYYSALLKYAPKQLPMTPLDNGLFVQRWFEPYAGGGQSTKFYAGDLVRVRLRVATNQERHWAAFEVPLPAGLEPVDTSLATTASGATSRGEENRGPGYEAEGAEDGEEGSAYQGDGDDISPWAYGFWSPFNHIEQRDSKIVVFADHLPPGVHVSSFVARATTPGTYLMKPARGELMYEPEVWGRSEGGTFEVAVPTPVSAR